MNPEAQAELNRISDKQVFELTPTDKDFLFARRGSLGPRAMKKFGPLLAEMEKERLGKVKQEKKAEPKKEDKKSKKASPKDKPEVKEQKSGGPNPFEQEEDESDEDEASDSEDEDSDDDEEEALG